MGNNRNYTLHNYLCNRYSTGELMNTALIFVACLSTLIISRDFHQMYIAPKAYFFKIFMSLILVRMLISTKLKRNHAWAFLFIVSLSITTLLSSNYYVAYWGLYGRFVGLSGYFVLVLMTMMIVERFTLKDIETLERCLLGVGVIYFLVSLTQISSGLPKLHSLASNPNMTGNVYVLLLPIALKFHILFAIAFMVGIYLAKAKGAMIAAGVVTFFWYVKNKWIRLGFIASLPIAYWILKIFVTSGPWRKVLNYDKGQRMMLLKDSASFLLNPLGTGEGVFRQEFSPFISEQLANRSPNLAYDHVHNVYFDHFIQLGWIPGIIFLWMLCVCFTCEKRYVRYFAIAYCIVGWGTFDTWDTLPIIFSLFGVALLCKSQNSF